MRIRQIESFDDWLIMKGALKDKGYTIWQTQYSWDQSEGYHIRLMHDDRRVEIVTHSREIAEDMIRSM